MILSEKDIMPAPKKKHQLTLYVIYISISIVVFTCLTIFHSYITYNQIHLVNFLVPISAASVVGFLLAKNKILQHQLSTLANTDKLTSAGNRLYFDQRLAEEALLAIRYKQVFSIIFFDLDYFKKVNDKYGHSEGDKALIDFSAIIRSLNRDTDLFARYGGEEFILLARMADKHTAEEIYKRIKDKIDQHVFGKAGHITFSAGIAEFDYNTDTTESIIKRADKALYEAKAAGRDQAVIAE